MWAHFDFKSNEKGDSTNLEDAICRICGKTVAVKNANTTNQQNHLRIHHPAQYAELGNKTAALVPPGQLAIAKAFGGVTKYKRNGTKWRMLTDDQ